MTEAMLALLLLGTGRLSAGTLDALARDAFAFWDGGFRDNTTGKTEAHLALSACLTASLHSPVHTPSNDWPAMRTFTLHHRTHSRACERECTYAQAPTATKRISAPLQTEASRATLGWESTYCHCGLYFDGSQPCHPWMGKYVLTCEGRLHIVACMLLYACVCARVRSRASIR